MISMAQPVCIDITSYDPYRAAAEMRQVGRQVMEGRDEKITAAFLKGAEPMDPNAYEVGTIARDPISDWFTDGRSVYSASAPGESCSVQYMVDQGKVTYRRLDVNGTVWVSGENGKPRPSNEWPIPDVPRD